MGCEWSLPQTPLCELGSKFGLGPEIATQLYSGVCPVACCPPQLLFLEIPKIGKSFNPTLRALVLVQSNLFSQQRSKYNGNYFRISNLVLLSGPGETLLQEVQVKGIFRMGGICPKIELGIKLRLSSIFTEGN